MASAIIETVKLPGGGTIRQEDVDRYVRVHNAARVLVERMREVHDDPVYKDVWVCYYVHNSNYEGPQYSGELEALAALLG